MIFLGNLKTITGTNCQVGFQHNMPFDVEHGIRNNTGEIITQAELEQIGVLVDSIPAPQIPVGQMVSAMYVDTTTKAVTYDYEIIPPEPEERISALETLVLQLGGVI